MEQDPQTVCNTLLNQMQTLQMSSVGEDGTPHCGYTPYISTRASNGSTRLYIFVSQLAAHTRDLLANGRLSVMIIADEQSTHQVFARTRVTYQCTAEVVPTDTTDYNSLLDSYQERHGKMAGLLRQLPDFVLFRLKPVSGQFVMGFGQAYKLAGDFLENFEHARTG